MRLYISADMEGVNGIARPDQVTPGHPDYQQAREWMLQEVNAAIEGARDAGVKEVVVNDSHSTMTNLSLPKLHPSASLITGSQKPLSMMQGLDSTFDAAFFLGYHAKMGTINAVLDHTFAYSIIRNVKINNISVGEFGLNSGFAGHFGVRSALVTGDRSLVTEAKTLIPHIEAVAVKEGLSRESAYCFSFSDTLEEIRVMGRRAIDSLQQKDPLHFSDPLQLEIEFAKAEMAQTVTQLSEFKRLDSFTVGCTPTNFFKLYQSFLAAFRFCSR